MFVNFQRYIFAKWKEFKSIKDDWFSCFVMKSTALDWLKEDLYSRCVDPFRSCYQDMLLQTWRTWKSTSAELVSGMRCHRRVKFDYIRLFLLQHTKNRSHRSISQFNNNKDLSSITTSANYSLITHAIDCIAMIDWPLTVSGSNWTTYHSMADVIRLWIEQSIVAFGYTWVIGDFRSITMRNEMNGCHWKSIRAWIALGMRRMRRMSVHFQRDHWNDKCGRLSRHFRPDRGVKRFNSTPQTFRTWELSSRIDSLPTWEGLFLFLFLFLFLLLFFLPARLWFPCFSSCGCQWLTVVDTGWLASIIPIHSFWDFLLG